MLLNEMEVFYQIIKQGSFSKAADKLGVSKSFVSKHITKLETDLNLRLLTRSTRQLILTQAGQQFYIYCEQVVNTAHDGYSSIQSLQKNPTGSFKVSAPPAMAQNLLLSVFNDFLKHYPNITLNLKLENQLVNLLKDNYDLLIRTAPLEDSNFIAQRIYTATQVICATKQYFEKYSAPIIPKDLNNHNCAIYSNSQQTKKLKLLKNNNIENILISGNLVTNQLEFIKHMTIHSRCLAILPEFMVKDELKQQTLLKCLTEYRLPEQNVYAIYPDKKFILPTLNFFLHKLKAHLHSK